MSSVSFYRRGLGFSQKEVSDFLGITRQTYSKKENDEVEFTKTEIKKITQLFQTKDESLDIKEIFFTDRVN